MMRYILCLAAGLLVGCVTSKNLNQVALGQNKADVMATLGKPHSVAAKGNITYLVYWLDREHMGGKAEYFVLLENDRVTAFGSKGDFDTVVTPKTRIEVENR